MRLLKPLLPYRTRRQRVYIKVQDGRMEIVGRGAWYSYWRDPYHLMITVPWTGFLSIISGAYLATNAFFALLYSLGGDCIANAEPGSYLDKFFFSVQTLATIGYGAMYPKTAYANAIVTIEALVGIVGVAVLTGLAFARFSRPTARVLFSRVAVIASSEEVPMLRFRAANRRSNQILEAQMRAYLLRDEFDVDGQFIRRIHDLHLHRTQTPSFALTWLAAHSINESSPLFGMTAETLVKTNSAIAVTLSGIDETVAQVVNARYMYSANDILWNSRFVDVIYHTAEGHRYIDYNFFHDVESLD